MVLFKNSLINQHTIQVRFSQNTHRKEKMHGSWEVWLYILVRTPKKFEK